MLKKNFVKEKLQAGNTVIGTWVVIPSVINVDIITSSGLDFVIIDREHGPISFETAQEMAIACELNGASPIMRVGEINKSFIQNALDTGMHGIQVPNIDDLNDALKVVEYSKYPPVGNRGFSPFTRAGSYSLDNAKNLMEQANQNTLVVLNVEGRDAIDNIDKIVSLSAVDVIFVGLFDLSKAMGIPGQVNDPNLLKIVEDIVSKARQHNKFVGTISTDLERLDHFQSIGVKYLVHLVDCEMIRSSYASICNKVKSFKGV